MDHSSDPCVHPEQLIQLPNHTEAYSSLIHNSTPELAFHPQQPMEFIDTSLEYHGTTNGTSSCTGQESLADSGYGASPEIPRYLAMPVDLLEFPRPGMTPEDHNDATARPPELKHEDVPTLKREKGRPVMTHSRRSSRSSNKLTSDESGLDKRERNRMAAYKCRKKQKLANNELQERARIMSEQHNYLVAHKASLESEMINLKNELLLHGTCGCEPITDYLMQSARRFVKGREEGLQDGDKGSENLRSPPPSAGRELCIL
ncbi:hypothetical protein F5Y05DRAFT_312221 [Hypoxylon sp. FL0543]|nr:hypothetical protein F5Y05DRAFT_312221 [Hypoxylon sp. FL0543]